MIAIMDPSYVLHRRPVCVRTALTSSKGSGESTLLNVLVGRQPAEGLISVNGEQVKETGISHISAYVEQTDALLESLAVRETLSFAAK